MTPPCFLVRAIDLDAGEIAVTGDEARHAVAVRRLRAGEEIMLSDGKGSVALGTVADSRAEGLVVSVSQVRRVPRPVPRVEVALGVIKGDRMNLAVAQLTEAGVDAITPLMTERTAVRLDSHAAGRSLVRWRRRVSEASKQARRAWLPAVHPCRPLRDFAADAAAGEKGHMFVLDPSADASLADAAGRACLGRGPGSDQPGDKAVVLVVGPEGGLSEAEQDVLAAAGAVRARLGPDIMRVGTAALAGLAVLSTVTGRWHTGDRD